MSEPENEQTEQPYVAPQADEFGQCKHINYRKTGYDHELEQSVYQCVDCRKVWRQ